MWLDIRDVRVVWFWKMKNIKISLYLHSSAKSFRYTEMYNAFRSSCGCFMLESHIFILLTRIVRISFRVKGCFHMKLRIYLQDFSCFNVFLLILQDFFFLVKALNMFMLAPIQVFSLQFSRFIVWLAQTIGRKTI